MRCMRKERAIELLGGSYTAAAEAVGISATAVWKWPDELTERITDRVIAALVRAGRPVPKDLLAEAGEKAAA